MGGHMQQSSAAVYDHTGGLGEGSDPTVSRWLQSTGLQHLASTGFDQRLLPNLLTQGGALKLRLKYAQLKFSNVGKYQQQTLVASCDMRVDRILFTLPVTNIDGFMSPEMRGDFGAGLLDLHAIDDNELLSEHALAEAFEISPFMPVSERGFEYNFDPGSGSGKQQMGQMDISSYRSSTMDKEVNGREGNLAKIRVVVRKRPLNKKELARKEEDIITIDSKACSLTVHETKLKVDLTAYVEKSEFTFDAVLDEYVTNEEVYRCTVEPIIPTLFRRTKATCFAYGQTG
ncbi:hypothetical protein KI387_006347 [Taxus chinensis]|uniref:Kinesin motor domain-containing protein n=1 Tax=Taxus chinensis TaxID=29808 RepID=A0AA38GMK6_TAXCH|nr:hypothetical protein KI387_006347 [Taxus chinensis]